MNGLWLRTLCKTYLIFSLAYRFKEVRGTPLDTYNYDCYVPVDVRIKYLAMITYEYVILLS